MTICLFFFYLQKERTMFKNEIEFIIIINDKQYHVKNDLVFKCTDFYLKEIKKQNKQKNKTKILF